MELHIRLQGRRGLARQVHAQVRAAILSGRLRAGERLPPTRELARRLGVGRNTVMLAYEWLIAEGLLAARSGAGTFVQNVAAVTRRGGRAGAPVRTRTVWRATNAPVSSDRAAPFDFGAGMPDATLFPFDTWRRLTARQIRASKLHARYGDAAGDAKLRTMIARYVGVSRGVDAGPEDILVTNGAQQAFDLIAHVLLEPGMRAAVEEPGYPPARLLFESAGARVDSVLVDREGLDVATLADDVRLVYVTPSHQFPLGMPMPHARRVALLEWAERHDAVIIEDDYDSEFRFSGRPLDTLQSLDRSGRVIYVGSFSKSLLPAFRLGFLVAPPALRDPLREASYVSGGHPQLPSQAALASLIESGLLARHVAKVRRVYAERHERILRTLLADFAEWLTPVRSLTGMHLSAVLRSRSVRVEGELAARAAREGVAFDRLSRYYATARKQAGIVLGYGAIATGDITEGLRRLRRCCAAAHRR